MQTDAFGIDFAPQRTPIEFHVDDFEAAKAELESRGIEFVGEVIDSGVCWQTFFNDPDGNMLAIHHRYARQRSAEAESDGDRRTAPGSLAELRRRGGEVVDRLVQLHLLAVRSVVELVVARAEAAVRP